MTSSGARGPLYLYAIVDRRPGRPLGTGIGRRPLSLLRAGKAYVVVERADPPALTPAAVLAHDRVVRRIARASTAVLPLRFASTARDREAVEALVGPLAPAIARALERVAGAVQLTLRVRGRRARVPKTRGLGGPGTRWLVDRIAKQKVPEIAALSEATQRWVREVRVERQRGTDLVATVYHLVAREDARAWRVAVGRVLPLLEERGVFVTFTGPWPPYAFAELE